MEKLWTVADVATYYGISESAVEQLVQEGKLTGQLLGGHFLRFQPEAIKTLKSQLAKLSNGKEAICPNTVSAREQVQDFIYFYDLYLLSGALLLTLIFYLMLAT